MLLSTKTRVFKVHSFVWTHPEIQIKRRELSLLLYSHFISVTYTTGLTFFTSLNSYQHQYLYIVKRLGYEN